MHDGRNIFAPASAGVVAGRDARDPLELLKNAELALNQAKRAGGGCARVYSAAMEALAPGDPVALETELRNALEQDQLDIFYQPIVRLADGTRGGLRGADALAPSDKGPRIARRISSRIPRKPG